MGWLEQHSEALKVLAPLGSWALVIAGWVFVSRDNAKRHKRQEELVMVDGFCKLVANVRDTAIDYHTKSPEAGDAKLARQIRMDLSGLENMLARLQTRKPEHYRAASQLIEFRRACTMRNFDSATRCAVSHHNELIEEIWLAGLLLTDEVQTEFERANRL